ncbi:2OG-Fe(II) oxygenase [Phenylobacterium sp.]|uniref:2OG-Fe(II) oxygenase family protein n=1 Tax=Phenylobacterium sp. TaxID=1871053 RepID=UPI0012137982|nr:2OG-Fe(II) oxygenase [Phenylobacterium sp.]THD61549.1 MAG: 2OG-Fe(II) oxygenase [Phenylobacterium sp.]
MTHMRIGDPAPWFNAPTPTNPGFSFPSVAGRYILLGFPPADLAERERVFQALSPNTVDLDDGRVTAFVFLRDQETFARARDRNGIRWFFDPDDRISRLYGAVAEDGTRHPMWMVLDPSLRVLFIAPIEATQAVFERLRGLPPPDYHAGGPMHAPVMIMPRLFDPELCRRLITYYETNGGKPSGVMREENGRTVGVLDNFKKRRDCPIDDEGLQAETRGLLQRKLLPEIKKAFRFNVTRLERYIVARYGADEGGYFRPHRDNLTAGTAHREFACSINLNAEEFEGGDLRFPEYGMRTYRPPTGGAVVFSCSLLHEATPVTKGARYAFLPFFYNEAGDAIRERNAHLITPQPNPDAPAEAEAEPAQQTAG